MRRSIATVRSASGAISVFAASSMPASNGDATADLVAAVAAVATAVVTVGAVLYARGAIESGRTIHRRQIGEDLGRECRLRVEQYLARLNHPDFLPIVAVAQDFLIGTPATERRRPMRELLPDGTLARLQILAFMNFFEEVSDQYLAGMLDEQAAERMLASSLETWWEHAQWFVVRVRDGGSEPFGRWEECVREILMKRMLAAGDGARG